MSPMVRNIAEALVVRGTGAIANLGVLLVGTHALGRTAWGEASLVILNIAIVQAVNDIYAGSTLVHFIPDANLGSLYRRGVLWTVCTVAVVNPLLLLVNTAASAQWPHILAISFIVCVTAFNSVVLLATERVRRYHLLVVVQPVLMFVLFFLFTRHGSGIDPFIRALYLSHGAALALSVVLITGVLAKSTGTVAVGTLRVIRKGAANELGNLAHVLSNRFNYFMLQGVLPLVGLFASGSSLIESVWIVTASISPLVLTHIANRRDHPLQVPLTVLLAKLSLFLALAAICVLGFLPASFFTWLLGRDFAGVRQVMLMLSPGIAAISFSGVISHYFSAHGRQRVLLKSNVLGLCVTLILSYPLVSAYGFQGACLTAVLAYIVQAGTVSVRFFRETGTSWRALFRASDLQLLR